MMYNMSTFINDFWLIYIYIFSDKFYIISQELMTQFLRKSKKMHF